jgi:hypothetical protein
MTEINRFHLYLSSAKRTSGSIEDYDFILQRPLLLTHPHHYFKVIVKQATIPYTFQQVNTNYNQFQYRMIRGGVDYGVRTFTLSNGCYTILTLLSELKTRWIEDIQNYLPAYTPAFSLTYDRNTMFVRLSFTPDSTDTSFTVYPLVNQISTMIGLMTLSTFSNVGATVSAIFSTQPVNVSPITSVYIRSASLKQSDLSRENIVNPDDISDILVQVPILNQPTSWIQYLNDLQLENRVLNTSINELNLYLTDNRSYSLDLRDIDWSCVLTVIEYEPRMDDAFHQVRKDFQGGMAGVGDALDRMELKPGVPKAEDLTNQRVDVKSIADEIRRNTMPVSSA